MDIIQIIKIVCVLFMIYLGIRQVVDFVKNHEKISAKLVAFFHGLGFVLCFFDVLGIGFFAPSIAIFHLTKTVDDKQIPGTLNMGAAFTMFLETFLFLGAVDVDPVTLILPQIATLIGAFFGARVNEKINVNALRAIIGAGLGVAALLLLGSKFGLLPSGGEAMGLTGIKLIAITLFAGLFGFLMPLTIGHYAPMMAIVSLLGMSPLAAFPIMMPMGAIATMQGALRAFKNGLFNRQAAFGLVLSGSIGILFAVYVVKSLPLEALRWLVICVLIYTSITMIIQASKAKGAKTEA